MNYIALYWQAQEVAQMAIKAREAAAAAAQLLQEARDELTATEIVLAKLETEVTELQKMIEECKTGDVSSDDILGVDSAVTGTIDMKDLETGGPQSTPRGSPSYSRTLQLPFPIMFQAYTQKPDSSM